MNDFSDKKIRSIIKDCTRRFKFREISEAMKTLDWVGFGQKPLTVKQLKSEAAFLIEKVVRDEKIMKLETACLCVEKVNPHQIELSFNLKSGHCKP